MAGRLNGAQQENIISILAHDPVNGKIIASLANPELFEAEFRTIAEHCIDYWQKHGKPPGVHTADLVADILDDPNNRKANTYRRILRNMQQLAPLANTDYVLQSLRDFTRLQRMKSAILSAAETLNAKEEMAIGEAEEILADLLRSRDVGFAPGLRLTDVNRIVDYFDSHYSEFRTGISQLDKRNIVPSRGEVCLLLAPTGRGKTWFLVHMGKHGLLQRKRVVHVSLEMSEEQVGQRYLQSLFSIPKHTGEIEVATLEIDDETGKIEDFGRDKVKPEFTFGSGNIRKLLKAQIKPWKARLPNLLIKRFPTRGLTINGLRAYLDGIEATENFVPDMLILDYIGIMSTDAKNHRLSLGRVFEEFRGLCVERNIAGVTVHQTSKVSADARMVKATHVSEDWSLIATADQALTYSATLPEERLGLGRIFVAKARTEEDKFGVVITQSYRMGQFVLQSAALDAKYYEYIEQEEEADEKRAEEEGEDED